MSTGFRERIRQKPDTRGMQRAAKASVLQDSLVLTGEPLEETPAQHSLWPGQPEEISLVVAHLLVEFHLLIQEVVLQEATEMRVWVGRTQAMQIPKGLVQVPLQNQEVFHGTLSPTPLIRGQLLHVPFAGWFCSCKRPWAPSCFFSANSQKRWPQPSRTTS